MKRALIDMQIMQGLKKIVCLLIFSCLSVPAWAGFYADEIENLLANNNILAILDVPDGRSTGEEARYVGTESSLVYYIPKIYDIPKNKVMADRVVGLYQIIHFAYAVPEQAVDQENSFYSNQFDYNPSDLRIDHSDKDYLTIIPVTADDLKTKKFQAALLPSCRKSLDSVIAFRARTRLLDWDIIDKELFKKTQQTLQPLIDCYGIKTKIAFYGPP